LSYLEAAGLISWEGTQITQILSSHQSDASSHSKERESVAPKGSAVTSVFTQSMEGLVQFNVSVKVNMSEFSGWHPDRISRFFSGIAEVLAAKGAMEKESTDK
jgi:hypothetical protein